MELSVYENKKPEVTGNPVDAKFLKVSNGNVKTEIMQYRGAYYTLDSSVSYTTLEDAFKSLLG